ncbi:MAG: (deoxy)nucleoside triphosphate pyrophosphohydrolase [Alphaproteobacteria bacterium]|nr:(deoxy)nucleoside triphosphate pyrophosphohydrolase [Alphaproteobacteria bacterium]
MAFDVFCPERQPGAVIDTDKTAILPGVCVVAIALLDKDNRVLLAQRPEGKQMAGLWEFAGGKLEPGETPEACIIRELKEELDVDTSASCLSPFTFTTHIYGTTPFLILLYLCRRWQGIPVPKEGQNLVWVKPQLYNQYPMPEANVPLMAMLRDLLV